jgi:hypothetical protein
MLLRLFSLRDDSRSLAQHRFERPPWRSHGFTALHAIVFYKRNLRNIAFTEYEIASILI